MKVDGKLVVWVVTKIHFSSDVFGNEIVGVTSDTSLADELLVKAGKDDSSIMVEELLLDANNESLKKLVV